MKKIIAIIVLLSGCFSFSSTYLVKVGKNESGQEMCVQKMNDGSYSNQFVCPQ